jgi:hypothetical protein
LNYKTESNPVARHIVTIAEDRSNVVALGARR